MCGIFGIKNIATPINIDKDDVKISALLMKHRGPDAYGQWGINDKIELAHLRLSIIDLHKESNQPFFSNCGNYVIVFNGEIYNYIEIREELISIGYRFRTRSDTEVLLNSYIEWQDKCVEKFNGDWAFAIYNIKNDILFCSRDRFGVKPFNYAIVENQFVFSSEIKSILSYYPKLRTPNYNVIANYCRNSLGAQIEETWFEGIKRLLPAHNLTIRNGEIKIEQYWKYPEKTLNNMAFDDAKKIYRDLFLNAVKLRMRSDVPVGTTLSSGLDSSSIVSVLRKFYDGNHKTFTASFINSEFHDEEKRVYKDVDIDESTIVKKLSEKLSLDSHFILLKEDNFVNDLSKIIYHLESGHSSPAILPLSQILLYAKSYVTVVMEGQGADELLSGYIINTFITLIFSLLKKGKLMQAINEIIAFQKHYSLVYSFKMHFRLLNNIMIEHIYQIITGKNKLYGEKLKKFKRIKDFRSQGTVFNEKFNELLFRSHTGGLVNLLHYGDAISMSKSMESRMPFLDVNLVEFCFKLPFQFKMRNGLGKYIHRMSMNSIVPQFILENPVKFGFNTPLSKYFMIPDGEPIRILLSKKCMDRGVFDHKELQKLINKHISREKDSSTILYRFLSVELWFRKFIDCC